MRYVPLLLAACLLAAAGDDRPAIDVPRLPVAPLLTAALDDPAWATAAVIPALGVSRGVTGEPLPTEVRLGWDAQHLYVRFICTDPELYTPERGRDADLYKGDVVEVFLDAVGDGAVTMEMQVNPNNDVLDLLLILTAPLASQPNGILEQRILNRDYWNLRGWDLAGLRTAAAALPDGSGWIGEFAIPARTALRRLGRKEYAAMELRANLLRYEYPAPAEAGGKRELLAHNWSLVQLGCPHISPGRHGLLRLVE